MSNKKKKKTQQKKPVNRRRNAIIAAIVAVAVIGGGLLTWCLCTKEPPLIVRYNGAMTARAQAQGYIGPNEVLIVHTVDDSAEGYTVLECYVYQLPEGIKAKRALKYYAHELPQRWDLEQVGTASAKFIKDDLGSLYAMTVTLVK